MNDLNSELKKIRTPRFGEIWWVGDEKVRLKEEDRVTHNRRPVLVLNNDELLSDNDADSNIINIAPLSSRKGAHRFRIPIKKGIMNRDESLDAKETHVLIQYVQPLEFQHFEFKCGNIDYPTSAMILEAYCYKVLAASCFDISI